MIYNLGSWPFGWWINTMSADILFPCVAKILAAMVLPSQFREMIENAMYVILYFPNYRKYSCISRDLYQKLDLKNRQVIS